MTARARGMRRRLREFFADEHGVALALDAPAGNGIERRRAHGVTGAKAEARVVQRTPDRIADEEPVAERAMIVRAVRADSEHLIANARDQHLVVADAPDDRT